MYIKTLGYKPALYISGWLGTPIHELSHASMAIIFGFKVRQVDLFKPEADGTLGSVVYTPHEALALYGKSVNSWSPWRHFSVDR